MNKLSRAFACLTASVICFTLLIPSTQAQTKRRSTMQRTTASRGVVRIPRGTEMKIRLENEINTKEAGDKDPFTAVVLTPSRYADSKIEGHIAKINKSGKLTGKTELSLAFDRILLKNGSRVPVAAQVVKVYGEDSAKVDEEGNIESGSKGKTTAIRSGGGGALGAIVGGIAGGGKGAAIGAIVGAGAGAGSTYIQGSNKVKLERGTEILIRTTR